MSVLSYSIEFIGTAIPALVPNIYAINLSFYDEGTHFQSLFYYI